MLEPIVITVLGCVIAVICSSLFLQIHQITDPGAIPAQTPKQRVCKTCNATFEHKSELRAHRRAEHPHEMGTIDLAPDMFVIGSQGKGVFRMGGGMNKRWYSLV